MSIDTRLTYEHAEAAARRQWERAAQQGAWERAGYGALGYVEEVGWDGIQRKAGWVQRHAEDVRGLPAAVVAAARSALAAEQAASKRLDVVVREAAADAARKGLQGPVADYHISLARGEAWAAHQAAGAALGPALTNLGQVAEQVREARQTLAAAPGQRTAIEQDAARKLAQLDREEQTARAELARLGASE